MESRFLTNYTETTFLSTIQMNLRRCKSFAFSVSFIKKAGLVLLAKDISAAIERGAKGRIITSTYQNFTDVESLNYFLSLAQHPNFECHLDDECFHDEKNYFTNGFHSKGYIFELENGIEMVVGSSNITRYALLKNIEWDLVVNCEHDTEAYLDAMNEFESLWNQTYELSQDRIKEYSTKLSFAIEHWDMDYDMADSEIKPNYMQRKALRELNRYRAIGQERALVISATGSGKTYLAAFDALNFNPDRLLYIVHEGSILKKSLETFQKVFGGSKTCGLYNAEAKETGEDFLFSTNVSMCRSLELFDKKEFDYIIIDECHHAVADSYRKIIDYFEPEFLLGLTATENRMDNQDVVEIFGNNIPYELRLRDAIINDLIVPFHYYGIRDELVDYGLTASGERRLISQINIREEIPGFKHEQLEHALRFLEEGFAVKIEADEVHLCGEREQEYEAYLQDLLNYGLTQYEARYAETKEDFLLWQDYRQDQVLLKILENPKHNQYGTYYKDGNMYIFAGLKKDASLDEHLKYNDKFLSPDVFQWESIARISAKDEALQRTAKRVLVFVRKVSAENGITLPYTYIGTGHLENPRKDVTTNGSILYDIHMDNPLSQELQEDFQWME